MSPMMNPFADGAFTLAELTAAINVVPNQYGRIQQLGIFPEGGVTTTSVNMEHNNGVLNLLPYTPRGGPASMGAIGKRVVRTFNIPQVAHEDVVLPDEVQNIRAFGSDTEMMTLQALINTKLSVMAQKHDITREWHQVQALQGKVLDADGTSYVDYHAAFGISRQTQAFDLGTGSPATEPKLAAAALLRYMETNLLGDTMTRPRVFCSPGFWDNFIVSPSVMAAWDRWQEGQWLRQDPRAAFTLWGIEWEEYIGQATDAAGNTRLFIPSGEAFAIPMGTNSTFKAVYGPADFNETVNTLGRRLYAKQEERPMGRGWDLHSQSNPLPLCFRPALLVKVTAV